MSAPYSSPWIWLSTDILDDNSMTGMCLVVMSFFIFCKNVSPSITGIKTSQIMRSGRNLFILSKASCPFSASITEYEFRVSIINCLISSWSSITRMFFVFFSDTSEEIEYCCWWLFSWVFLSTLLSGEIVTVKVVYSFILLSTTIFPFRSLTKSWHMAKPMPLRVYIPLDNWFSKLSRTLNLLNIRGICWASIPVPLLVQEKQSSFLALTNSLISIFPFFGVYLNALDIRLKITFSKASLSTIHAGISGRMSNWMFILFWSAISRKLSKVYLISSGISIGSKCRVKCPVSALRNSISCCIWFRIRSAFFLITLR